MESIKKWFKSKTIAGIVMMLTPLFSAWFGFQLDQEIETTVELIGGLLAVYGRITANKRLKL